MEQQAEQEIRLAALCHRLGHLWPKTKKAIMDKVVSEESLEEGQRTIFGQLHGNPQVNFQAFQSTMKKAWKTEQVVCTHLEPGLFSFVFENIEDKHRVIESGPWSFSRHLLVLQSWEPSVIPQCLSFDISAFWIHIVGLPVEGRKEEVISKVAETIGKVVAVKIETKGVMGFTVSKAKICLDLNSPLEPGLLYSFKEKVLWLDFRYERLPTFCYSCGKIGHYAQNCNVIPYKEGLFSEGENQLYGSWLRAETNLQSPFWKSFYEAKIEDGLQGEGVPETQQLSEIHGNAQQKRWEDKSSREERGKRKMSVLESEVSTPTQIKAGSDNVKAKPLMIEFPHFQSDRAPQGQHVGNTSGRDVKKGRKEHNKEESSESKMLLDDMNLLDTPVFDIKEANLRAMVAGPNKPLVYK